MLPWQRYSRDIRVLAPVAAHWYPASLQGPRAATAAELCESLPEGVEQHTNPVTAFEAAASVRGDDVVLGGWFHTVGEVLEHWQKKETKWQCVKAD